jgi:integrase
MTAVLGGSIESRFGPRGKKWLARPNLPPGPSGERHRAKARVFTSKKDAETWLAEKALEREKGIVIDSGKLILARFVDRWLESLRHTNLAVSTRRRYADVLRLHVLPVLGHRQLRALSPLEIQELYATLQDGGLSAKTTSLIHTVLHKALKQAVNWDLIARNVTERVTPPPRPKPQVRGWDAAQTARFLAVADCHEYGALWRLALHTGMRRGELLGLKWNAVDFNKGTIRVEASRSRGEKGKFIDGKPKTVSGRRSFPLSAEMIEILRRHRTQQLEQRLAAGPAYEAFPDGGYVFAQPNGRPLHPNTVARCYKHLIAEAGVPERRLHDTRHTNATLSLESGESVKEVSERLGHANIGITLDLYVHPGEATKREAANRFDAFLKAAQEASGH